MRTFQGGSETREMKKLKPRYMGSYPITERVGEVAYRLSLPDELRNFHKEMDDFKEDTWESEIEMGVDYTKLFEEEIRHQSLYLVSGTNPLLVGKMYVDMIVTNGDAETSG
ncbi:unnamed protein product [Cochlearia groenlandica]